MLQYIASRYTPLYIIYGYLDVAYHEILLFIPQLLNKMIWYSYYTETRYIGAIYNFNYIVRLTQWIGCMPVHYSIVPRKKKSIGGKILIKSTFMIFMQWYPSWVSYIIYDATNHVAN